MSFSVSELAFHQRLGRLMARVGKEEFWPALAGFLREHMHFDTWVAMLFRPSEDPTVLADKGANVADSNLFHDYARGIYLLDPFYTFSMTATEPGFYRLDEVAPEHFRETEYFRRYFSLNVVEDEVQFLVPMQGRGVLSFSLGSKRRFTDEEIGFCYLFLPWLLHLMRLAAEADTVLSQEAQASQDHVRSEEVKESLRQRGKPHLTEREVEVALLILGGHSTKGVARQLGISIDTAKAHRRNMYAKLGVSNQAGLFLLMMAQENTAGG
ncbi:helix-turn-helix transcriptional regulator [Leeia oryzae]|uniref:helix-turn-helix transcriptional regulator n=1 Tax=Leeia oryzae TaxID=356662 RepID=UPI000369CDCD|nr:helix-turn-helix transcriptional regulator [Leeia oryzae]